MSPKHLANPLHGILLIVLFSFSAFYIADFEWVKHLSFSPLIVGIVLGMLYACKYAISGKLFLKI